MQIHNLSVAFSEMVRVMVFNASFNNISVILWRSVLLMEENGVPVEDQRPAASH
jgi:energy-converting hydrogenase Eha subunit E